MLSRWNLLVLIAFVAPLIAGKCGFSSGDSKAVVSSGGGCTAAQEMAGQCGPQPQVEEAATSEIPMEAAGPASAIPISKRAGTHSSAFSIAKARPASAARAVPEPTAALLFFIGAALVAHRAARLRASDDSKQAPTAR